MKAYRQNVNRFKFILQWKIKWKLEWSARESTFLRRLPASCVLVQIRTKLKKNKQNQIEGDDNCLFLSILYILCKQNRLKFIEPSKGKQKIRKIAKERLEEGSIN